MTRRLFSVTLACSLLLISAAGCVFDTTGLSSVVDDPVCGDGQADLGEACDGADLDGRTCALLGYAGGTLACTADCQYDESGCTGEGSCGDGVRNGGANPEACDGADLGGQTCQTQGFAGGALACAPNCWFDVSGCHGPVTCGNGALDPGEDCDGDLLGDDTCESLGLGVGDLACNAACAYDLSGCEAPVCGDGQADGAEVCDDGETDSCAGTCNANCTGPANECGDGQVACGEACEEGHLQGANCTDFGYADPAGLACDGCDFDLSGCHSDCGDGVLDPGEVCEDGNTVAENGTTDFCGPLCTTTTWACAGGWPGYFPPTNTAEPWVTFSNTVLNGSATRYAIGTAGSTVNVSVTYTYDAVASGCPGCVVQLYWGFFAGPPPASDADPNAGFKVCRSGIQNAPNSTYTFSLTLPTAPGTYYLRWARSWEYSCNYNVDANDPDRDLAVICVR